MRWLTVVLCLVLSAACVAVLPQIERRDRLFYLVKEPFFINPAPNKTGVLYIRSDSYGKGYFGASRNGGRTHKGIDVISPVGAPVLAAKSGRVFYAGEDKGYGNYVEIHHPDGLCTRYAHLSQIDVKTGDWVAIGALVGKTGKTGNAKNPHIVPHLHFEIRNGTDAVNPTAGLLDPKVLIK
jgi:murein DD-endopeptidase MepM/ murein hydrolase activator NlpD